ncbi:SMI1/KNR4 family protein [Paenibacillus hexagrammi]|uniref:SMI1/KNR4 family protein n=1 Tax=Paenibacillus hexagrammi TaxID=2908839 RepID=A0ABY3SE92_9BACL|nr:SMI1/KNR4 family protein [Paenibacillus sp. YPD9-1]UJF32231.1 SMI1/KNR4 family protein [Paenibacillus sp. YPD9-1]
MTTLNAKSIIENTLSTLHKRIDNYDGTLLVQRTNGYLGECRFQFHEPANQIDFNHFEEQTNWCLPSGVRAFYEIHNGASLFMQENAVQFDILSLNGIVNNYWDFIPEHWYPVASHCDGDTLLVDSNLVKQGQNNCLIWFECGGTLEHAIHLPIPFEVWFDRFIISQGDHFWLWGTHRFYE